jgi:hypothetical protein
MGCAVETLNIKGTIRFHAYNTYYHAYQQFVNWETLWDSKKGNAEQYYYYNLLYFIPTISEHCNIDFMLKRHICIFYRCILLYIYSFYIYRRESGVKGQNSDSIDNEPANTIDGINVQGNAYVYRYKGNWP